MLMPSDGNERTRTPIPCRKGPIMKWLLHLLSGILDAFSLQSPGRASALHDAVLASKADAVEALLAAGANIAPYT